MRPLWLFADPAAQRARTRPHSATHSHRTRPPAQACSPMRCACHGTAAIAVQAAFVAAREPAARLVHGRPLRMHRVDADSAARHADTSGNVC